MNEKDVLAIAENFTKCIKNKEISNISSESMGNKNYATLEIKVNFRKGI